MIIGGSIIVSVLFIYQIIRLKRDKAFDQLEAMFTDAFEHEFKDKDND